MSENTAYFVCLLPTLEANMTATPNDIAALQPIDPTAATANNHVDSTRLGNGGDTPSAYPESPYSEQIVGADSGMIKPPERPDD